MLTCGQVGGSDWSLQTVSQHETSSVQMFFLQVETLKMKKPQGPLSNKHLTCSGVRSAQVWAVGTQRGSRTPLPVVPRRERNTHNTQHKNQSISLSVSVESAKCRLWRKHRGLLIRRGLVSYNPPINIWFPTKIYLSKNKSELFHSIKYSY